MNDSGRAVNPFARAALALPARSGHLLSVAARSAGGALALAITLDQEFERTRALALAVSLLALASFVPLPDRWRARLAWIGAGLLFFGGALLAHLALGKFLLATGALAALGAAVEDHRRGRMPGVASFFTGFGLTTAVVITIVLSIEG